MGTTNWEQRAEDIARAYGNDKQKQESDGSWFTLCPAHGDKGTPNLHITAVDDRILTYCHTCGDANQSKVIEKLIEDGFILQSPKKKKHGVLRKIEVGGWIRPIPSTVPPRPTECYLPEVKSKVVPIAMWAYCNEAGEVLMYNARFEYIDKDNAKVKLYRRLAFYENKDTSKKSAWAWFQPNKVKLPLYGLEKLTKGWNDKLVLLVEGEKACEAAQKIFPEAVVLAYSGGAGNYERTDWSSLTDSNLTKLTIWPDNDPAGKSMAHGPTSVSQYLRKFKINCKVVNIFDKAEVPHKWDLADTLPDDWAKETLKDLLEAAVPADVLDQERVLQHCEILRSKSFESLKNFITVARTPCDKLGDTGPTSACHTCLQCNRINSPSDIVNMPQILLDWTYLSHQKIYYNLRTQEELDPTALNAVFAHYPDFDPAGKESASNQFQTDPRACKVYDYNYQPELPVVFKNKFGQYRINKWPGYSLSPMYGKIPEIWFALAKSLFPVEKHRMHIYDWMACMLQRPGTKINHGLLMISEVQGVGKDSFIQPLRDILGVANYKDIASNSLDSDFNEYLFGNKLVIISELDTIGHRRSTYDKLKPLLACPPDTLDVNIKNLRAMQVDNIVQMIAFSNKHVPVVIEGSDRRLFVQNIAVTKKTKWSATQFKDYYLWLKSGGSAEVFGWLMERDISHFNYGGDAPNSSDKEELSLRGDSPLYCLKSMIDEEEAPFHKDIVTSAEVKEALKGQGYRRISPQISKEFDRVGLTKLTARPRINGVQERYWSCRRHKYWAMRDNSPDIKKAYLGAAYNADLGDKDEEQGTMDIPF